MSRKDCGTDKRGEKKNPKKVFFLFLNRTFRTEAALAPRTSSMIGRPSITEFALDTRQKEQQRRAKKKKNPKKV